jgi:hypothetical protein
MRFAAIELATEIDQSYVDGTTVRPINVPSTAPPSESCSVDTLSTTVEPASSSSVPPIDTIATGKVVLIAKSSDVIELCIVREKVTPAGWFTKAVTSKYLDVVGTITYSITPRFEKLQEKIDAERVIEEECKTSASNEAICAMEAAIASGLETMEAAIAKEMDMETSIEQAVSKTEAEQDAAFEELDRIVAELQQNLSSINSHTRIPTPLLDGESDIDDIHTDVVSSSDDESYMTESSLSDSSEFSNNSSQSYTPMEVDGPVPTHEELYHALSVATLENAVDVETVIRIPDPEPETPVQNTTVWTTGALNGWSCTQTTSWPVLSGDVYNPYYDVVTGKSNVAIGNNCTVSAGCTPSSDDRLEKLEEKCTRLFVEIAALKTIQSDAFDKIEELEKENHILDLENEKLDKENRTLDSTNRILNATNYKLDAMYYELNNENEKLRLKNRQLEGDINCLKDVMGRLFREQLQASADRPDESSEQVDAAVEKESKRPKPDEYKRIAFEASIAELKSFDRSTLNKGFLENLIKK